ncbi:MAG: hydroxymethylbilane synthase [Verrucomicrobiota bacterium]
MAAGSAPRQIVLGTRGSELALVQARMAQHALSVTGIQLRIEVIRTRGDERSADSAADSKSGRKGAFTAELEMALLDRRIDIAVHSAKDLPSEMTEGLTLAAVLPRAVAEDFLVTKRPMHFDTLPAAASIASGSIRRQRQALFLRPDLQLHELRGNVPTRLRKFIASTWDGIVLAGAGLSRLGFCPPIFEFEEISLFIEKLPRDLFVPAGGQGVVALQTRAGEENLVAAIDDSATRACLQCERDFLHLVAGDCGTPVGAHARISGTGEIQLTVQLFGEGTTPKRANARGRDPRLVAIEAYEKMEGANEHK